MHMVKLSAVAAAVVLGTAGVALAASSPTVSTGAAASETQTSAVLNGTVNPGGAKTFYFFQWGTSALFGAQSRSTPAGSGTKTVSVHTTASGLVPGTTYYYRLVASNSAGESVGKVRTFKTQGNPPPVATTGGAHSVGTGTATVTGVVYPQNEATTFWFQYGLSPSYTAQTLPQTVGGAAAAGVSATLYGLASGTVFHYRLVVQHGTAANTTSYGQDSFFETLPSPRPRPRISAGTAPRRGRTPATFLTAGHIRGPASTPALFACAGRVRVTYWLGHARERTVLAPVQPNCTFGAAISFRRLPGKGRRGRTVHLNVTVRFLGNAYLAPVSARRGSVTLR